MPAPGGPAAEAGTALRVQIVPPDAAGIRLDQALARMFPELSRSRLATWTRAGHVRVDGALRDPKYRVWGGERIELTAPSTPEQAAYRPEAMGLDFLYEDDAIAIVDKPAGLVVHPGSGNWQGTLANAMLHHAPQVKDVPRAGIVHRLDKDTSGLMVVAKTVAAQVSLVRQLQARSVRRDYAALVEGLVARDGSVEAPLGRDPRARTRMAVVTSGKPARTWYAVIERFAAATLLECRLDTGRTHQIRVHMAQIGHPIIGDPVYGGGRGRASAIKKRASQAMDCGMQRQALHARRLALIHPVSGFPMQWESRLPADMAACLDALRRGTGT